MKKYTINLPNVFYFFGITALIVYLLIVGRVILVPLIFSFFLP
jgi:hypothetical protein